MADAMAALSIYNHYLSAYAPTSSSAYDSHKKDELKNIYSSIIRINKDSPFCIIDTSTDAQKFAVSMKEEAISLKNTIASLGGMEEKALFQKKTAVSTNEKIATVAYIAGKEPAQEIPPFEIGVTQLAAPQKNTGHFLPAREKVALDADNYSFDLNVDQFNYEFQFQITEQETNESLQHKLARLINNSGIGISASVLRRKDQTSALQITSKSVGLPEGENRLFTLSDASTSKKQGTISYLGLNSHIRRAKNAVFTLNGNENTAYSNDFTIENAFRIHLEGKSENAFDTTRISTLQDTDSFMEHVETFVNGYNRFYATAKSYVEKHPLTNRLITNLNAINRNYHDSLEQIGIVPNQDGMLALQKDTLYSAIQNISEFQLSAPGTDEIQENPSSPFHVLEQFAHSIINKSRDVVLNPMDYIDKRVVEYKNPNSPLSSPYITSPYSGMMFNNYC